MLKPKTIVAAFEACWELEPATVKQVVEQSGLSDVTVRRCLDMLCERGEIFELSGDKSYRGATPSLYMTTKTEAARKAAAFKVACQRRDAAVAAAPGASA